MSKKYKVFLLFVLLLPQIHYFPHIISNDETDLLTFLFWTALFTVAFSFSGGLLALLINRHKRFYSKATVLTVRLFSLLLLGVILAFIVSFFSTEALPFMAYLLPYFGVLAVVLYLLIYYIVVVFILKDMKKMIQRRRLSLFEKFGLFIPFLAFGFSAFSGYFTESLFGGAVFLELGLANIDVPFLISLVLMLLSLANPIIIIKVGIEWIKHTGKMGIDKI